MLAPKVLFVCLGNICRSPLAEAAFRQAALARGVEVEVDSAGTADYHVGEPPDPRSVNEAHRHGIDISGYRGRQLETDDFHKFDYILGMDRSNMTNINKVDPGDGKAQVAMLLDMVPGQEGREVSDPWYGDDENFRATWADVHTAANTLISTMIDEHR